MLIYNIVLSVAGCEDYRATDCNSGSDERRGENVLVLDQDFIDPVQRSVRDSLPLCLGFVRADAIHVISVDILEVACHFSLGLWVLCRNKFWLLHLNILVTST